MPSDINDAPAVSAGGQAGDTGRLDRGVPDRRRWVPVPAVLAIIAAIAAGNVALSLLARTPGAGGQAAQDAPPAIPSAADGGQAGADGLPEADHELVAWATPIIDGALGGAPFRVTGAKASVVGAPSGDLSVMSLAVEVDAGAVDAAGAEAAAGRLAEGLARGAAGAPGVPDIVTLSLTGTAPGGGDAPAARAWSASISFDVPSAEGDEWVGDVNRATMRLADGTARPIALGQFGFSPRPQEE